VLVALVVGREERARVSESLRGRSAVRFVERIDELSTALDNETRQVVGLLLEPHDGDQRSVVDFIRGVRHRRPGLPVIGYCRVGHEHSAAILSLAAAGVHELVFRGIDDSGVALRSVLRCAEQSCASEILLETLLPMLPASMHPFARYCLTFPQNAHTVAEVASALGVNRKTLVNYCARASLPAPATLLAWCRLLLASYFLVSTTRTVERIALQLDFPSDTALRNMIKRYTGLRATDLRGRGEMRVVFGKLEIAISTYRTMHEVRA
jgi:AraC-like DNA-binding protein